jgi:hypothetical protein
MPTARAWIALGALIAEVLTVSAVQPWRRDDNGPILGLAVGGAGLAVCAAIAAALPDPIPLVVWWSLLTGAAAVTAMAAIGSALVLARHAGEVYRDLRRRPARIGVSCGLIGASALVVVAIVAAPLLSELPSLAVTASAFLVAHVLWLAGYMLSSAREVR